MHWLQLTATFRKHRAIGKSAGVDHMVDFSQAGLGEKSTKKPLIGAASSKLCDVYRHFAEALVGLGVNQLDQEQAAAHRQGASPESS